MSATTQGRVNARDVRNEYASDDARFPFMKHRVRWHWTIGSTRYVSTWISLAGLDGATAGRREHGALQGFIADVAHWHAHPERERSISGLVTREVQS